MRIMFLSDRIFLGASAYTKITRETCLRLNAMGHQIAHIPMGYANRMGKQTWNNILIYKSGMNAFGEDVALYRYNDFEADLLVTYKEPWVFNAIHNQAMNFVPAAIIDHTPVSHSLFDVLMRAYKVIAITRFGQREIKKHNINSDYIPHGIPDCYTPLKDQKACRDIWYLDEDSFVVGIVAMNRSRKMITRMIRGYKRFIELNPDVKSNLFLWTNIQPSKVTPEMAEAGVSDVGVNLIEEIANLGLHEGKNDCRWMNPADWSRLMSEGGLPEYDAMGGWDMVKLYNSMDCLLLCSGGEGFGMPLVEAQACGKPVITTDYAGGPEQVGAGYCVPYHDYVIYDTPGVRRALASIDGMADALTRICNRDKMKYQRRAVRFAQRYRWDNVMENYWVPFLEDIELDLYPKISKTGVSSWL